MKRKIGLFFLSLWLLFLLIFIITIDVPISIGGEWKFIGIFELFKRNIIPFFCLVSILIGVISYFDFKFKLKGAPSLSFKIIEIENVDYEHLTFLTTYIVPLVCFNFVEVRYLIVFAIIIIVIAMIYIRTDLFYANPTLAILKFRIYKIDGEFRDGSTKKSRILITREILTIEDRIKYIKLDERIYYAIKVEN